MCIPPAHHGNAGDALGGVRDRDGLFLVCIDTESASEGVHLLHFLQERCQVCKHYQRRNGALIAFHAHIYLYIATLLRVLLVSIYLCVSSVRGSSCQSAAQSFPAFTCPRREGDSSLRISHRPSSRERAGKLAGLRAAERRQGLLRRL